MTQALPWLLDQLGRHDLNATFFVEAINCELYPDAVADIAAHGHELGHHGWSHEQWAGLSPDEEREAFVRGLNAYEALGLRPRGFPPAGRRAHAELAVAPARARVRWCSPAGGDARIDDGLAYVPFDWELVDAYHLMDSFAPLRASRGDPERADSAARLSRRDLRERVLRSTGRQTLILHPFLMLDPRWAAGVSDLLETIADQARAGRTWVVSGGVFADWLRGATT